VTLSRRAKVAIAVPLALVALAGGAALVLPRLLWGDGVDYSHVASIEATPEYKDVALLAKAWALPVAARYRAAGLVFQPNGSLCGPTSAADVLGSVGAHADPASLLEGSGRRTYFGLLPGGITLDDLGALLHARGGGDVTVLRDLDLAAFRAHVAAANDPARRYIVNFHRGPLFGRGGGHHSPIAGWLAAEDLVFVLDVNADYQPWLVKTERLFAAVDTVDRATGRKRGLLMMQWTPPTAPPVAPPLDGAAH
jgi:hypothetical protein